MTKIIADASPTKKFFLEMFTRDISLEDSILDLVDNSIDSLIRTKNIDVSDSLIPDDISKQEDRKSLKKEMLPEIRLTINKETMKISDNCGGIPLDMAKKEVFRFGHETMPPPGSRLGVYGIGLKRALFKIGNLITITSKTKNKGFKTIINVKEWSDKKDLWEIPLTVISGVGPKRKAGTTIIIEELHPEVKLRLEPGTLETYLYKSISTTYSLFLERYVRIILNGHIVEPKLIPIGKSLEVTPGKETLTERLDEGEIKITIIVSLASRKEGEWKAEDAGWYALCNGRVVVSADKSELTGWGVNLPLYHSKLRGFVGIVCFYSNNPNLLPWTTTKRGLNMDSKIYIKIKQEMNALARPIISFLNSMYKDEVEEPPEREMADKVELEDMREVAKGNDRNFEIKPEKRKPRSTVAVQYKAEKSDLEKVRKWLKKPSYPYGKIGKFALDYFIKTECPE
jgi:hypothetical protein